MSDRTQAEPIEQLPLCWDPQSRTDLISVPLTSGEYEALRQIWAEPDSDVAAPLAS